MAERFEVYKREAVETLLRRSFPALFAADRAGRRARRAARRTRSLRGHAARDRRHRATASATATAACSPSCCSAAHIDKAAVRRDQGRSRPRHPARSSCCAVAQHGGAARDRRERQQCRYRRHRDRVGHFHRGRPRRSTASACRSSSAGQVGAKTQSKFFVGNVPIRPPRADAWGIAVPQCAGVRAAGDRSCADRRHSAHQSRSGARIPDRRQIAMSKVSTASIRRAVPARHRGGARAEEPPSFAARGSAGDRDRPSGPVVPAERAIATSLAEPRRAGEIASSPSASRAWRSCSWDGLAVDAAGLDFRCIRPRRRTGSASRQLPLIAGVGGAGAGDRARDCELAARCERRGRSPALFR